MNTPLRLSSCVTVVVLGFFSPDDTIKSEHFNFSIGESQKNYFEGDERELFAHLVGHFSPDGSTILDMTGLPGKPCMLNSQGCHAELIATTGISVAGPIIIDNSN